MVLCETYVVDGALVEEVSRDDLLDDLLEDLLLDLGKGDLLSVLSGDDDGVDAEGDGSTTFLLVLNGDLSLGVGAEPRKDIGATSDGQSAVEFVGKHDGEGHELLGLIGGISEHDTLVTSTVVLEVTVVQSSSNIRGLLLNGNEDVASFVVETF